MGDICDGLVTVESLKEATIGLDKLVGLRPYEDEDKYEVYYNFGCVTENGLVFSRIHKAWDEYRKEMNK